VLWSPSALRVITTVEGPLFKSLTGRFGSLCKALHSDPFRSVNFLHSRRSAKLNFCESEFYEAVIGDFTLPAMIGRSEKFSIADVQFEFRSESAIHLRVPFILVRRAAVQRERPLTVLELRAFERQIKEFTCCWNWNNPIYLDGQLDPGHYTDGQVVAL
jgi:hypothetical protein